MSGPASAHRPEDGDGDGWLIRVPPGAGAVDVLAALRAPPARRLLRQAPGAAVLLRRTTLLLPAAGGAMDVAWCARAEAPAVGGGVEVRRIRSAGHGRPVLVRPRWGMVVLAGAGAFERWSLQVGDRLAVRGR